MRSALPRGFTLAEVMVVMVIAGVVSLGLVGFYLNSQATWMDASSQALAQRDATALVEAIAYRGRAATSATISVSPPDKVPLLTFYGQGLTPQYSFWWSQVDSLVHSGPADGLVDEGPVIPSRVEQFSVSLDPSLPLVHLTMLQLRSETGVRVRLQSTFTLYNAP